MNDIAVITNYWNDLLIEYDESISIPKETKKQRTEDNEIYHSSIKYSKHKELLKMKAAKLKVTESAIIETALAVLLQRYNYINDVVYGRVVLCNHELHSESNESLTVDIYSLPVRVLINSSDLLEDTIRSIDTQWHESLKHNTAPRKIMELILKLDLINVTYLYIKDDEYGLYKNTFEQFLKNHELNVCIIDSVDSLEIKVNYDKQSYSCDEIELFLMYFESIIDEIVTSHNINISELELIHQSMKNKILNEFNTSCTMNEYDRGIVEIFEEQARINPNKNFALYMNKKVSYKWMNDRANQIAWTIRKIGVEQGELIFLSTERSIEMVIGMLGILKAGAAFVPVNQQITEEQFDYLSRKCKARMVLTYNSSIMMDDSKFKIIDLAKEISYSEECSNIEKAYSLESNAFCLFTSGTTGEPKGVLINHKGFTASLQAFVDVYGLENSDIILQFSDYTYIQGIMDIFNIMVVGGTICLLPVWLAKNPIELDEYCEENDVTFASLTPTIIAELDPQKFQSIRILDTTGEPADVITLKKWLKGRQIMNSYGATELSGNTSSYHYHGEDVTNVPIGKPAKNAKYYIVDKANRLCGVGMVGELCIASVAGFNGYLGNEKLTEARFIKNPFHDGMMYRTGDLAKWLIDGNVECLGRIDNQVKIRGCRVELSGIKNAIMQIEGIDDCAVITRSDWSGDKVICAYLVSKHNLDTLEITKILEKRLISVEVPQFIMQIPYVPFNKNGKLDKSLLPDICLINEEYSSPKTLKEKLLCNLLAELFNVPKVSLESDFFQLGGDSIKAVRLASRLKSEGYRLSYVNILKKHRVKEIAEMMVLENQILKEEKKNESKCNISSEELDILKELLYT